MNIYRKAVFQSPKQEGKYYTLVEKLNDKNEVETGFAPVYLNDEEWELGIPKKTEKGKDYKVFTLTTFKLKNGVTAYKRAPVDKTSKTDVKSEK